MNEGTTCRKCGRPISDAGLCLACRNQRREQQGKWLAIGGVVGGAVLGLVKVLRKVVLKV